MNLVAQVIVDVPAMQTNRPYDYSVPDQFQTIIQEGMRIVVPFGRGSRSVQGFVVGLKEESQHPEKLKSILEIMDLEPVLNKELIELGRNMSNETYSFLITCYQSMLPAALRASYEKFIVASPELEGERAEAIFEGRNEISWKEAEERDLFSELKKLRNKNLVRVRYEVSDHRTYQTIRMVKSLLSYEAIEEESEGLRSTAKKQKLLLAALQKMQGESWSSQQLNQEHGLNNRDIKVGEEKGWLAIEEVRKYRNPYEDMDLETTTALNLSEEQQAAYQAIASSITNNENQTYLLKGITGSGKTEVYMQVIDEALKEGKTAVVLVPEIALTPQMVTQFKGRFGQRVAVMHSGLSDGERYDEWQRLVSKEADVVVGARSSIFAPVENLGVIIIDEEHEGSYKQNENPRYHARNVAKWRGDYHHCPVVLGSATPSLESRARASKGVYQLLEMNQRPTGQNLPEVQVVNLRDEAKQGNYSSFSNILLEKIKDRLEKKEQIVLMLNRRGYSSFIMCRDCGFVLQCPNCDIAQTLHMDSKSMKCHYCGHEEQIPSRCPKCTSSSIRYYGTGTQKVEEELQAIMEDAKIVRMDRDTTRRKGAHEKLLDRFGKGQADILLGTQMIAKGLDFPNVTLVGVLNADTSLNLPDFRSSEKTFQLLTQVSGRAGRGDKSGQVLVQTYNPEHYAIQLAQRQDYDTFYKYEMQFRHKGNYPPYYFTLRISVSHEVEREAYLKIYEISQFLKPALSSTSIMLGPTPSAIARTQNKYHYQIIIKYKNKSQLHDKVHELMQKTQKENLKGLHIAIDPEPNTFM